MHRFRRNRNAYSAVKRAAALAIILLVTASGVHGVEWPPANYTEVRAFYNGNGESIVSEGKLDFAVDSSAGALLTRSQVNRLLAAAFHTDPNHVGFFNCYEPRHRFVFYDDLKRVVGVIEVCLECLHVRYAPEAPAAKFYIDYPSLGELLEELGLPLGPTSIATLRRHLAMGEQRWRERKPIDVKAHGNVKDGVIFQISDQLDGVMKVFNVTHVWVWERTSEHELTEVWTLDGEQPLEAVTYGARYISLNEKQRPEALQAGKEYEVIITHRSKEDRSYSGTARFSINRAGVVVAK